MKIKVAPTSKSAGCGRRRSSHAAAAAVTVFAVFATMFAARTAAVAQQAMVFKAAAGRVPRVYNALITSDQQLLPSQADPIVAPVLRPFQYFYDWPGVYAAVAPPPRAVPSSPRLRAHDVGTEAKDSSEATNAAQTEDDGRLTAVIKNNRPADSLVPDVPPPPLPVSRGKENKKKPEEFPPAPVGFAM